MKNTEEQKAVIYTRVASGTASDHAAAHAEQEQQCRDHADTSGYAVAATFRDDISGNVPERPGMAALLAFLEENRGGKCRVIILNATRLSRDIGLTVELMTRIIKAGGSLDVVMQGERRATEVQFRSFLTWAVRKYKERKSARVNH